MLSTQNLEEHRWRRKGWERGFGGSQLREYEPRVIRHLEVFNSSVERLLLEDKYVDMTSWAEFFAYDVMSDLAFSEDFGMLKSGKADHYIRSLHGATRVLTISAQTPWIRPLMPYLMISDPRAKQCGLEFAKISRETFDRRSKRSNLKGDMFSYISLPDQGSRPLSQAELIADSARKSIIVGIRGLRTDRT